MFAVYSKCQNTPIFHFCVVCSGQICKYITCRCAESTRTVDPTECEPGLECLFTYGYFKVAMKTKLIAAQEILCLVLHSAEKNLACCCFCNC